MCVSVLACMCSMCVWWFAITDSEHEVVEGLIVDVHECDFHGQGKVSQICQVLPAFSVCELLLLHRKSSPHNHHLHFQQHYGGQCTALILLNSASL